MTSPGACGHPSRRAKSAHLRMTSECVAINKRSIPRDDLALALVNIRRVEQVAGAAAHQEFGAAGADRVVTAAADRGFARAFFRQLRKREDVAPHLPGRGDL